MDQQLRQQPQLKRKTAAFLGHSFAILAGLQILSGIVWVSFNFAHIPEYGDTNGYISLSQTLISDSWRPIGYPLIIRIARNLTITHFHSVIYILQFVLFTSSISFFLIVLTRYLRYTNFLSQHQPAHPLWYLVFSIIISTNPILLHFQFSLMPDAFSTSFALIFLAALFAIFFDNSSRIFNLLILSSSLIAMSLIRSEKLYWALIVFAICTPLLSLHYARVGGRVRALRTAISCSVLVFSALSILSVVKSRTQNLDLGRPPALNPVIPIFSSIAWPRLSRVYQSLPLDVQSLISYEDAIEYDQMKRQHTGYIWSKMATCYVLTADSIQFLKNDGIPNNVLHDLELIKDKKYAGEREFIHAIQVTIGEKLATSYHRKLMTYAEKTSENDNSAILAMWKIIDVAFREYWPDIFMQTGTRFVQYNFAAFVASCEAIVRPHERATGWTVTRMSAHSMVLSRAFLLLWFVFLSFQSVATVVAHRAIAKTLIFPFVTLFVGSVVNSSLFCLVRPVGWHVRYSLISYVTVVLFLSATCVLGIVVDHRTPWKQIETTGGDLDP